LGLAQNWQTVPAWIFVGALLGSVHPTVEAIFRLVVRLAERVDAERPGENRVSE